MKSSSVSDCRICKPPPITDWGEGDCIKCTRDKVLNQSKEGGKPSLAEHNKQETIKTGDKIGKYIACVGGTK